MIFLHGSSNEKGLSLNVGKTFVQELFVAYVCATRGALYLINEMA